MHCLQQGMPWGQRQRVLAGDIMSEVTDVSVDVTATSSPMFPRGLPYIHTQNRHAPGYHLCPCTHICRGRRQGICADATVYLVSSFKINSFRMSCHWFPCLLDVLVLEAMGVSLHFTVCTWTAVEQSHLESQTQLYIRRKLINLKQSLIKRLSLNKYFPCYKNVFGT